MSNSIKVEKHFHKYNINYIYKNTSKTTVKTLNKTATASVKTAKPISKPATPAKPSGGKKK